VIRRILAVSFLFTACALAVELTGAGVAQAVRETALDPEACYRVRELNFAKEDLRFYLGDGFIIFSKPVLGERLFALFSAEVEGGDAELLVMPPHRSERRSLANFSGSPNLDEHLRTALFVFSDGTGNALYERAKENGRPNVEYGTLIRDRLGPMSRNIAQGFEVRLVQDLLTGDKASGVFFAAVSGLKLGNFDVIHDPWGQDQILIGQYSTRGPRPIFDTWTSFQARSVRTSRQATQKPLFTMTDYRIDATLDGSLHMTAVTRAKMILTRPCRAFGIQLTEKMQISSVAVDGKPAELYARESPREAALRSSANVTYVVVTPGPLDPASPHEIEFKHEGDVVLPAGNGVFFVASRGNWYPRGSVEFANYDLTFRYPKRLTLAATGEPVEDKVEGECKIAKRHTTSPVRLIGFNLGDYESVKLNRGGYTIEVYGNRHLETSLQPKPVASLPPIENRVPRRVDVLNTPSLIPAPSPTVFLNSLAENIANSFEYMRSEYGAPPLKWLAVTPIPGAFGQGFPGIVYLSTLAYLRPDERPPAMRTRTDEVFFGELLPAHEVAHQWWGNSVGSATYQDEWLMEALASYSSLEFLEKRRGARAVDQIMESYQQALLHKLEDGRTVESIGPVTYGSRLHTSQTEAAWRTIIYEKGAWILHMLRRRMGDAKFRTLQNELNKRFAHGVIDTEQFRAVAEEVLTGKPGSNALSEFFESWVYGTGIPTLSLKYTVGGKAPAWKVTGSIAQSGVDDDFDIEVPVEVHFARGPAVTQWVRTSNEPAPFTINVKQAPVKVVIPAGTGILAARK
jgi:hypothetical protein